RDIGMRYGLIEAVEADIPAERALRVLDASGKLVTPGLIDLHCHVFPYGSAIGIPADELVAHQRTTTCGSAGDGGAKDLAPFPPPRVAPLPACRQATRVPTIPPPSAATLWHRRAHASTPSCTSPISDWRVSRFPSFTTSTMRVWMRPRGPSPRTPTSCSASRCACQRTSSPRMA